MVLSCQKLEEHIMLRANSENLSHFVHVVEDVNTKDFSATLVGLDETCQHGNGGGLTCTIMSKKSKDLPVVHGQIGSTDSSFVSEFLDKSSNLEAVVLSFLLLERV